MEKTVKHFILESGKGEIEDGSEDSECGGELVCAKRILV